MEFVKMQGAGNDFIVLDHFNDQPQVDYSLLARKLCHRNFGVGGDGLVVVLPSNKADARMRIFNADGSEPEMCGNGIRCFARYVYDAGYVPKETMSIETLAGILTVKLEIENNRFEAATVCMGKPILVPKLIPVLSDGESPLVEQELEVGGRKLLITPVSMGNPHCVVFVEDFKMLDFELLGPALEKHPYFPQKTNVEFVKVENPRELTVKVWERGAGPTLACGTGACASLVAAVLAGRSERKAIVHLPGGDLKVEWGQDDLVYMTGPAAYVFRGQILDESLVDNL